MRGIFVVGGKHLRKFFRTPLELIASLAQPLLWLLLFGVILDSALSSGALAGGPGASASARPVGEAGVGGSDYLTFLTPGIVALTAWAAALFGGTTFYLEKDRGLILQYLAAPIRRFEYFLGLAGAAAVKTILQVVLIFLIAALLGVRVPLVGAVLAMLAAGVFALGVYGLSVWLAAGSPTFESYHGTVLMLQVPLFFVSDALYPLEAIPWGLRWIAILNPLTHLIALLRWLVLGLESPLGLTANLAALGALVVVGFAAGARAVARWEPH